MRVFLLARRLAAVADSALPKLNTRTWESAAIVIALLGCYPALALAQTAQQVTPGYLTTTGCPTGTSACFVPYSSANPMPIAPGAAATSQGTPTTPALGDSVPVLANALTALWTANTATRDLIISFPTPPCTVSAADNSAQIYLTTGGYDFNQNGDAVWSKSLNIICATAQNISVAEVH
jgi:hypothetical protein